MTKHLNIVIHGVGEHRAGETLDLTIAAAFGSSSMPVESTSRLLPEIDDENQKVADTFPCEIRRVAAPDQELVFAEVYWADLSRGKEGAVATFIGLMNLLINLSHLIRESALQERGEGSWTYRLVMGFLIVLYGPVLALNAILFLGIPMAALAFAAAGDGPGEPRYLYLAFAGIALFAMAWGWYLRGRAGLTWLGLLFGWSVVLSGVVILVFDAGVLISEDGVLRHTPAGMAHMTGLMAWMIHRLVDAIQILYFVACVLMALFALPWAPGLVRRNATEPPFYVTASSGMALVLFVLSGIFWASVASTIDGIVWEPVARFGAVLNHVLARSIEGIPVIWALIAIVTVPGLVAVFRQQGEVRRDVQAGRSFTEPRRLIISQTVTWLLLSLVFVFAVLSGVRTLALVLPAELVPELSEWVQWMVGAAHALKDLFPLSLALAGLAGVLYAAFWDRVAVGVAMGDDVVAYFVQRSGQHPIRNRIHARVKRVLETMLASERPDTVTILAHSQGTVIAIDYIRRDPHWDNLGDCRVSRRQLVTMGSPYRHLYQHYFKGHFLAGWRPREKLDLWLNIFRRDDYIGTSIHGDQEWPDNRPVGPRGHTSYWTDRDVQAILISEVWSLS